MINLMLNNLSGEFPEGIHMGLEVLIQIADRDFLPPFRGSCARQGEAAFLRCVYAFSVRNLRINHRHNKGAVAYNNRKYGYNLKSQLLKLLVIFPAISALAAWICSLL